MQTLHFLALLMLVNYFSFCIIKHACIMIMMSRSGSRSTWLGGEGVGAKLLATLVAWTGFNIQLQCNVY